MAGKGVSGVTGSRFQGTAVTMLQHAIRTCVTRRASSWARVSVVMAEKCHHGASVPVALSSNGFETGDLYSVITGARLPASGGVAPDRRA